MQVLDRHGKPLTLGHALKRGGEGAVYQHPQLPGSLIKIYETPTPERGEKIKALVEYAELIDGACLRHTAWPTEPAFSPKDSRQIIGFCMPRINGRAIHIYYSPKERKQLLPSLTWKQLIQICRNVAIAFDGLHKSGIVVGDVNEGNFMVTDEGYVKLIDCDSYQVNSQGRLFKCPVGVGMWTPPELQGQNFSDAVRTSDHDVFGLAVLIFQLLFIGRHPFSAKRQDDHTIEQAIQKGLFCYSPELRSQGIEVPDLSLPINAVGQTIFRLFEQAFLAHSSFGDALVPCSSCGTTNRLSRQVPKHTTFRCGQCKELLPIGSYHKRPTAESWIRALKELEGNLSSCGNNPKHFHHRGQLCPFCELELKGHFAFAPSYDGGGTLSDSLKPDPLARRLWEELRVATIPRFPFTPSPLQPVTGRPLLPGMPRINPLFVIGWLFIVGGVVALFSVGGLGFILGIAGFFMILSGQHSSEFHSERFSRQNALTAATKEYNTLTNELAAEEEKLARQLQAIRNRAMVAFQTIEQLEVAYTNGLKDLETRKREAQLKAYLNRFFITHRKFHGLGPKRTATLQANGIETAADIYFARYRVQGIPYDVWNTLRQWSQEQSLKFVFDSTKPVPPEEIASLASSLKAKKISLTTELQKCRGEWFGIIRMSQQLVATISAKAGAAQQKVAQAEADVKVLQTT